MILGLCSFVLSLRDAPWKRQLPRCEMQAHVGVCGQPVMGSPAQPSLRVSLGRCQTCE